MYLIIDTSTRHGAVGLWRGEAFARMSAWHTERNHTAELMPAIQALLAQEGRSLEELEGIAVAVGPGGFSALRAGMSAAKGLAFALGVPLVGVSTLEASAYPYRTGDYPVCALLKAGRDLVAWARFQQTASGWRRRTPDQITPVQELLRSSGRHTLFCGEGVAAYGGQLLEAMGRRAHLTAPVPPVDRLQGAAAIAIARLKRGESDSIAGLQPHYLRAPAITPPRPPQPVRYGTPARG